MTAVWYLGGADSRTISTAEWQAAGVTGSPAAVSWNKANGWSLPATGFTAPQLTLLAAAGEFNTGGADGPRPGSTVTPATPSQLPASQGYVDTKFTAKDPASRQLLRERTDRRDALPLASGATVTVSASSDAALTKVYSFPVTGLSAGQSRQLTALELAAFPADLDVPNANHCVYKSQAADTYGYHIPQVHTDGAAITGGAPMTTDITVRTSAPKVQFTFWRILGNTVMGHQVFVNGQAVTPRPVAGVSTVDFVNVAFTEPGINEITLRTSAYFAGMAVAPIYTCEKPSPIDTGLVLGTLGDSYSAPYGWTDSGSTAMMQEEGFAQGVQDNLGIRYHYIDAIGGTGFSQRASGGYQAPNNNYQDRIAALLRANLDVFQTPNGCFNDLGNGATVAQVVAAVQVIFRAMRAARPNAKLIYGEGFMPPGAGATIASNAVLVRQALQTALADIGVYYVANSTWITGTGNRAAQNASGNSDWIVGVDTIHGTQIGYKALRRLWRAKLRLILLDDGSLVNTVV